MTTYLSCPNQGKYHAKFDLTVEPIVNQYIYLFIKHLFHILLDPMVYLFVREDAEELH